MLEFILLYFIITGLLACVIGYAQMTCEMDSELYRIITNIVWNTGLRRCTVEFFILTLLAFTGWIVVPWLIIVYINMWIEDLYNGGLK